MSVHLSARVSHVFIVMCAYSYVCESECTYGSARAFGNQ